VATNQKPAVEVPPDQPPSYQLELEDIIVGGGEEAVTGRVVEVHYVAVSWRTGTQIDASWDRGNAFKFGLGNGQVIAGWDQIRRRPPTFIPVTPHDSADRGIRQTRRMQRHRSRRDTRIRRRPNRRELIVHTRGPACAGPVVGDERPRAVRP
jgi:hypothetical protein